MNEKQEISPYESVVPIAEEEKGLDQTQSNQTGLEAENSHENVSSEVEVFSNSFQENEIQKLADELTNRVDLDSTEMVGIMFKCKLTNVKKNSKNSGENVTSQEEISDKIASNTTVEQEQIVPGFEADVENNRVNYLLGTINF